MNYNIQGKEIKIETNPMVFSPSPHGSCALGNSIRININDKVLDVGTGTGLLAILASKLGGRVSATDILPQSISLSKENAIKNDENIDFRLGNLFDSFNREKFDVIIANVPQENLSPKVRNSMSKEEIIGMDGGSNGNEILLKVLKLAPAFMSNNSRMYVVVYSMSNFRESLRFILENYKAKLVNFYTGAVKNFVYLDTKWYLEKSKEGEILIYEKNSKYWADLFVFELKIK